MDTVQKARDLLAEVLEKRRELRGKMNEMPMKIEERDPQTGRVLKKEENLERLAFESQLINFEEIIPGLQDFVNVADKGGFSELS